MPAAESDPYTYGNGQSFKIKRTIWAEDSLHSDEIELQRPTINEDKYQDAIDDINATWGVIKDPKTDKTFEIARANLAVSADQGVDAEMSTYASSISGNPGNAVEFAENSTLHPDRQRLYIASFGNGRSSYWDLAERAYIKKTGRFTQDSGEPLPTIAALSRALKAADFIISRYSTNSTGGAYATALMAAMPEGQVTHAYIKSRPNISDHPSRLAWGLSVLVGDILDDKKYDAVSQDPWKLTAGMVKQAKDRLPNVYSHSADNAHQSLLQKARSSHTVSKLYTDLIALSHGGYEQDYPASKDTAKALQRHPEALLTYHFPLQDRLYTGEDDIEDFLNGIYDLGTVALAGVTSGQIEVLTLPGKHRDHTKYPGLRWAVENYAFGRQ